MVEQGEKKVLNIVNENALGGGVGTVINYLTEGINKHPEFSSDTLLTEYLIKKVGEDEKGNKKYISKPLDSRLNMHDKKGKVKKTQEISHENLEERLKEYDIIHVHGIPHYGIIENLEKIKSKQKKPKIVNTAHSSVKQEFLSQYENAKSEENKDEFNALNYLLKNNILNNPTKFGENFWGSAIHRQEKIMTLGDSIQHMNESYMNNLIKEYKAQENKHKHKVIPNGIKISEEKYSPRPKKKRMLFVGRFSKEKGIDELIDSIPYILQENPDAEIKLVGGDKQGKIVEQYKRKLKKTLKNHLKDKPPSDLEKMLSKVIFTGWISDKKELEKHYKWADYVLIPSYAESFSLTASEALDYGRIPVMTATPALKDLYIEKGIGLGIDPKKRYGKGIAETMNEILKHDNTEKYDEIVKKGKEYVKNNYSFEKMIENQINSYNKLLK